MPALMSHWLSCCPFIMVDSSGMQALCISNPPFKLPYTKTSSDFFFPENSYSNTNGPSPCCLPPSSLTVLLLPSVDYYYLLFISHDTVLCFLQDIKGYTTPSPSLQPIQQSCGSDITGGP